MKTVIIAKYNEPTDWHTELDALTYVIDKSEDGEYENVGREPHSYFLFIVKHYESLEGTYYFTQGNPFDHCPEFIKKVAAEPTKGFTWLGTQGPLTSNPRGGPHDSGLDLHALSAVWGMDLQESYDFMRGSIFSIDAETIRLHSKETYQELLSLMTKDRNPWAMERLWGYLYIT